MGKEYLINFNEDGTRKNTYAKNVHYQVLDSEPIKDINGKGEEVIVGYTEEKIVSLVNNFNYQDIINGGGIWFGEDDYNKLIGNTDKEYIYKEGKIIEKPAYVPSEEEKTLMEINQIMAENDTQIADIKDAMLVAVLTDDTELQEELKQEYADVIEDTNNKLKEVNVND